MLKFFLYMSIATIRGRKHTFGGYIFPATAIKARLLSVISYHKES